MSSGKVNVWKRIFDLWSSIVKMVQNDTRSSEWLANKLQAMVDEPVSKFKLFLHHEQGEHGGVTGLEIEHYLLATLLIFRALSLESPEVKGWIENPESYPDEFKDKTVFLWGSIIEFSDGSRSVKCLQWSKARNRVTVSQNSLEFEWSSRGPALLRSEQQSEAQPG